MRILCDKGEFILPADFKTQLSRYNVLVTAAGEQSNQITLPPLPENLRLVNYSFRDDDVYAPLTELSVMVVMDLVSRKGNMSISNIDETDGITVTLYFGSAAFYSAIDETKMAQLPWPILKSNDSDFMGRVNWLVTQLEYDGYYDFDESNDWCAPPILTEKTIVYRKNELYASNSFTTEPQFLNGFDRLDEATFTNNELKLRTEFGHGYIDVKENDTTLNLTKGYSKTPFLKLKYVLNFVFEQHGLEFDWDYTVQKLGFDPFRHVFILNNVADAIYAGVLLYSQLVPNLSIKEFLARIEKLLAARFVINEYTNQVRLVQIKELIEAEPGIDLTPYLSSKPKRLPGEFKNVRVLDGRKEDKEKEDTSTTNISATGTEPNSSVENSTITGKIKDEKIEIDTLSASTGYNHIKLTDDNDVVYDVIFKSIKVDGLIHKNSSVIVDGKVTSTTEDSSTDLKLFYFDGVWVEAPISSPLTTDKKFWYKQPQEFMRKNDDYQKTEFDIIASWYTSIQALYIDSALPIEAKLVIPKNKLIGIDLSKPVLLNGQKLLIESMKYEIGGDDTDVDVSATFRTTRSYSARA